MLQLLARPPAPPASTDKDKGEDGVAIGRPGEDNNPQRNENGKRPRSITPGTGNNRKKKRSEVSEDCVQAAQDAVMMAMPG